MKMRWVVLLVVIASFPAPARAEDRAQGPLICLKPLGKVDTSLVQAAGRGITHLYGLRVRVLESSKLPRSAYYKPRRRYRADKILRFLHGEVFSCRVVMALTATDISVTKGKHKDWGIFGLAEIAGKAAVVSSYRLRKRAGQRLLKKRFIKVVNHELGHALGMPHIPQKGCLMQDAAGTIRTVDAEKGLLCEESRRRIELREGIVLPKRDIFDWATVL